MKKRITIEIDISDESLTAPNTDFAVVESIIEDGISKGLDKMESFISMRMIACGFRDVGVHADEPGPDSPPRPKKTLKPMDLGPLNWDEIPGIDF